MPGHRAPAGATVAATRITKSVEKVSGRLFLENWILYLSLGDLSTLCGKAVPPYHVELCSPRLKPVIKLKLLSSLVLLFVSSVVLMFCLLVCVWCVPLWAPGLLCGPVGPSCVCVCVCVSVGVPNFAEGMLDDCSAGCVLASLSLPCFLQASTQEQIKSRFPMLHA